MIYEQQMSIFFSKRIWRYRLIDYTYHKIIVNAATDPMHTTTVSDVITSISFLFPIKEKKPIISKKERRKKSKDQYPSFKLHWFSSIKEHLTLPSVLYNISGVFVLCSDICTSFMVVATFKFAWVMLEIANVVSNCVLCSPFE